PIKKYYTGKLNEILKPSFAGSNSTLDSARQIALALSTQPTKGHGTDQSDDLLNCVSLVAKGFGKCSDYAQSFAAACLENNIMVREVSNMTHTFNEIYLSSQNKWVFFDAQYCLTAHDNAGNWLSALDIFNAYANHTPFSFSSFAPYHKFQSELQDIDGFYEVNGNSDAYQYLVVTNGINVFQVNKWNQYLNLIPKPARQFVLLSLGIQPGYLVYDPNNQIRPSLMLYRFAFVFAILLVFLINLAAFRLWSRTANRKSTEDEGAQFIPQPSFARA
ncbi:MAG TPA: transglutaminase-like domain-containing protein, partial [Phnomibacter sp.]|nr:transglutaminase-like domain-containing protein [Phnomibacter sp.]